ncbi:MAG: complex I subunit 1 family protein [Kofleriaceae bacterium]
MRWLVVLALAFVTACHGGDVSSVKPIGCPEPTRDNPTPFVPMAISDGGFSTTNGLRTNEIAIHPDDIVKFVVEQGQTVSPGHTDQDKTTVATALSTTGTKCFQFAATGEYGFHSASYDGTVFVRSSIAELIFGLLDSAAIKWVFLILVIVMPLASLLTWAERRQSAMMQDRLGPNRANIGPIKLKGILHFVADALKMIFKEDFIPANVHKGLFALAPLIAIAPVLIAFCIIPFGPTIHPYAVTHVLGSSPSAAELANPIRLQIFSIDFGLIFYFAVLTLANYGGTIAGWASYNKWALLGGLRSSSQMMSYEVSMGLSLVGAFLICGTLEPGAIVLHGASATMSPANPANWLWLWQPVGLVLFFTAAIAETKRAPFDIPEGEPEIIGYFVEYSGMRWGIFFLAEFIEVVFIAAVVATVFFGGWQVPFLEPDGFHAFGGMLQLPHGIVALLQIAAFGVKLVVLCWFQLMVRWTLPRFRADQLVNLGWKVLLPTALGWIMFTALLKLVFMA